jgi:hypothetical protein
LVSSALLLACFPSDTGSNYCFSQQLSLDLLLAVSIGVSIGAAWYLFFLFSRSLFHVRRKKKKEEEATSQRIKEEEGEAQEIGKGERGKEREGERINKINK